MTGGKPINLVKTLVFGMVWFSSEFIAINSASAAPPQSKGPGRKIESLVVDVNGERRQVLARQDLTIVKGDLLTMVDVVVAPSSDIKISVDVIGYEDKPGQSVNDAGKVIDTALELKGGKSLKDGGRRFSIKSQGKGVSPTEFHLIVLEPQLISFDVEINGQRQRISNKDRLTLSPKDDVRVVDIQTNVRGNENVKHDLVTKNWADGSPRREIRFSRGSIVFARIPIDWKGS